MPILFLRFQKSRSLYYKGYEKQGNNCKVSKVKIVPRSLYYKKDYHPSAAAGEKQGIKRARSSGQICGAGRKNRKPVKSAPPDGLPCKPRNITPPEDWAGGVIIRGLQTAPLWHVICKAKRCIYRQKANSHVKALLRRFKVQVHVSIRK